MKNRVYYASPRIKNILYRYYKSYKLTEFLPASYKRFINLVSLIIRSRLHR
jgi:hypothetical protein